MLRICVVLAAVAAALIAPGARACSVVEGYVVPSNFELVQLADAIVVATPLRQIGHDDDDDGPAVRFRIESALKGETPAELTLGWASLGTVGRSDPQALLGAHPDAYAGGCTRLRFRARRPALLFLKRGEDGEWSQLGFPFARVNEDYFGPEALWPRTVRRYLDIQAQYDPMQQIEELQRIIEGELATPQTAEERERARDILSHLMSRSEWKPTRYLIETYEALERGDAPRFAFRPREADQERSAAQALTTLVFGDRATPTNSTEDQMRFVLNSLVNGDHPDAAPLFERILAEEPAAWQFGMAVEFLAKSGQYPRAYDLIESRAFEMLSAADDRGALALIRSIQQTQLGDGDWMEHPRWADHPEVAVRWPVLARRLWDYQVERFGANAAYPFPDVGLH